jgi:uncharacterized protein involved in exopolysaccharide biosynthesis
VRSTSRQAGGREDFVLSEILYILWQRVFLVGGIAALMALGALGFGLLREPAYTAGAAVTIRPEINLGEEAPEALAQEVLGSVANRELVEEAIRRSGWEGRGEEFNERLEVSAASSGEISVRFSAPDPERAAAAANAYAGALADRVNELSEGGLVGGTLAVNAAVERPAEVPERRSGPRPLFNGALAGGLGIVLGGALALVLEARARDWRGARDVELTLRAPVLGVIPEYREEERT